MNSFEQRIYDIEKIREQARQEVRAEFIKQEKKKKAEAEAKIKFYSTIMLCIGALLSIWIMSDFIF